MRKSSACIWANTTMRTRFVIAARRWQISDCTEIGCLHADMPCVHRTLWSWQCAWVNHDKRIYTQTSRWQKFPKLACIIKCSWISWCSHLENSHLAQIFVRLKTFYQTFFFFRNFFSSNFFYFSFTTFFFKKKILTTFFYSFFLCNSFFSPNFFFNTNSHVNRSGISFMQLVHEIFFVQILITSLHLFYICQLFLHLFNTLFNFFQCFNTYRYPSFYQLVLRFHWLVFLNRVFLFSNILFFPSSINNLKFQSIFSN